MLFAITRSRVPKYLQEFRELERADGDTISADEQQRLSSLLLHASSHVPYYKELLGDHRIVLDGHVNLDRFTDLPILDKDTVQAIGPGLHSDDMHTRHPFENTSGGSTGSPARFVQDRAYYDKNVVSAKIIYNEYLGKYAGEPEINLWGSERDVYRGSLEPRERIINYIYNRRFLNAFSVTESDLRRFVDEINRHKPVSMWVYVESIDVLATFIEDQGLRVHSPRFIISTAGTLYEPIRERVERVFGCPVFNQYGSREVGAIAIETRDRTAMRGFPYLNYVEIVGDEIIVTCLSNYSMPLIRYRIGDTAVGAKAVCDTELGVERPIMQSVSGRVISHFKSADGNLVHGQYLIHQFYFVDWIKKFQVVQSEIDMVTCNLVLNGSPISEDIDRIIKNIRLVMGDNCRVEFNYCDEIPASPSGKYLYTICKI
jgi:phenylacetate-CoA ligase